MRTTAAIALCLMAVQTSTVSQAADDARLPAMIAKRCGTPSSWVRILGKGQAMLSPSPKASYAQVECMLDVLKRQPGIDLGLVGNEASPNQPIDPPWRYILGGRLPLLEGVVAEARKDGWLVEPIAKAGDGTGYVVLSTPQGMTTEQANALIRRLQRHELGAIAFGPAPTKDGVSFDF